MATGVKTLVVHGSRMDQYLIPFPPASAWAALPLYPSHEPLTRRTVAVALYGLLFSAHRLCNVAPLYPSHAPSPRRTVAVALYGLLFSGPSAHYWQQFMQWLFCSCGQGAARCSCNNRGPSTVAKKVRGVFVGRGRHGVAATTGGPAPSPRR